MLGVVGRAVCTCTLVERDSEGIVMSSDGDVDVFVIVMALSSLVSFVYLLGASLCATAFFLSFFLSCMWLYELWSVPTSDLSYCLMRSLFQPQSPLGCSEKYLQIDLVSAMDLRT